MDRYSHLTFRYRNTYNAYKILGTLIANEKEPTPRQCRMLSNFFDILSNDPMTAQDSKMADMALSLGEFGVSGLL